MDRRGGGKLALGETRKLPRGHAKEALPPPPLASSGLDLESTAQPGSI